MAYRTILNKGEGIAFEATANAAITPGQVIELLSTGKVQKQATAKTRAERAVAMVDENQGNDIADDYDASALVMYRVFAPGDVANLILKDGETVVIGGEVDTATGGEVQAATSATVSPLGIAVEAVNASDSAATAVASRRIAIRFL